MKIEKVTLENFTKFSYLELNFPKTVTFIVGRNASGKTSIKNAISYCLIGRCERTDKGGRGADALIREGAKQAKISVLVDGEEVSTTIPSHRKRPPFSELDIVLDASSIEKNLKEIKTLLFNLIGLKFDKENIIKVIVDKAEDKIKTNVNKLLEDVDNSLFTGDSQTFTNLYSYFYNLRRDLRRTLKALPLISIEEKPVDIKTLENELREKRDKLNVLQKQLLIEQSNKGKRELALKRIERLKEKIEGAQIVDVPIDAKIQMIEDEISRYEGALKEFSKKKTMCPLVGDMPCTIKEKDKILKDIKKKIHDKKIEKNRLSKIGKSITKAEKAEIEAEIKELERSLPKQQDSVEPEFEKLKKEYEELEIEYNEASKAIAKKELFEETEKQRKQIEERLEAIEWLTEALSPNGLPTKILQKSIDKIEKYCNKRLKMLNPHYNMKFVLEPFTILVRTPSALIDFDRLSTSERFMISIVLTEMIAKLAGLKVLVLDGADVLDSENKENLGKFLMDIKDSYDTILVFATLSISQPYKPPWAEMYWLKEEGVVSVS